jgi:hypothetical protein
LGCIAHHEGEPCTGGGLVGSRDAKKWFANGGTEANFKKMKKFSKNPALGAYLNSLVNLGLFVTDAERPDSDEEADADFIFDDIELSALGLDLAKRFDRKAGGLTTAKNIASKDRCCTVDDLAEFGRYSGLCELSQKGSADRELLRDIFFAVVETKGESHRVRRQSLLLTLDLCRQFSADEWQLTENEFAGAVYYGEVANDESRLAIAVPPQLRDIAIRWRMFYFHHFMSVALEGLFSWLVSHVATRGLAGETVEAMVGQLRELSLRKNLSEVLGVDLPLAFADLAPSELLAQTGVRAAALDKAVSQSLDVAVLSLSPLAEDTLEDLIRSNAHLYSSAGLALPMILLSVTLARYYRWEGTNYGKWLASAANDPYLDLVPPLVTTGLDRRFGSWWTCTFADLTGFVLCRYVVQQHQSMSYEKTWTGERCLLQVDGPKIVSIGGFDKIGMGNPRIRSAIQILTDLGLIEVDEEDVSRLTNEGEYFLEQELAKEVTHEVS